MTAAITAAAEGKSVVIVESQPVVGGNSVRATGGMNAGDTRVPGRERVRRVRRRGKRP